VASRFKLLSGVILQTFLTSKLAKYLLSRMQESVTSAEKVLILVMITHQSMLNPIIQELWICKDGMLLMAIKAFSLYLGLRGLVKVVTETIID